MLKKVAAPQALLQAIKEQDIDEIVNITLKSSKDLKSLHKYVDIPKYFQIDQNIINTAAIRYLIMNGKLNLIYNKSFPPMQCQTDFRLLGDNVNCDQMLFILESA